MVCARFSSLYCSLYRAVYKYEFHISTSGNSLTYCPLYRAVYDITINTFRCSYKSYCPLYRAVYFSNFIIELDQNLMTFIALYIGLSTDPQCTKRVEGQLLLPSISGCLQGCWNTRRCHIHTFIALYIGLSTTISCIVFLNFLQLSHTSFSLSNIIFWY